jgi:hypothetical protein
MDSLQNGDSLVMLGSLVGQLVQPAPHRCPPVPWRSAREMRCGKICHAECTSFRVENGQRDGGLRESIDCFLETVIGVQIPGVVNVGEADQRGADACASPA